MIGLLAIFGLFVLIGPDSFHSARNLETIARQTTIVGIGSLGMTLIIIAGGIDLSIGSVVALATVVIAWFLGQAGKSLSPLQSAGLVALPIGVLWGLLLLVGRKLNWKTALAAVITVAGLIWLLPQAGARAFPWEAAALMTLICAAFGLLNGALVTGLRVVPFIVTLGTMLIVRGAAKGLSHEQKIDAPDTWLNSLLASLAPEQRWMLVPAGVWLLIGLAVLVTLVLRYTRLGRHTFAIGSNEQTARLCGVAVDRVKLYIYTLGGAFGGLAGLMQFSRLTVGDPTVAAGLELDVIAAVVIGGGSLSGGEGSILGSLVGALIMSVIRSGCSQMGLPNWVQEIITGIIIIVAVALDRLRHRRAV